MANESKYIINAKKQSDDDGGNYEMHNANVCSYLPDDENQLPVGFFESCKEALFKAKLTYPNIKDDIDGCAHCCSACHKG